MVRIVVFFFLQWYGFKFGFSFMICENSGVEI